MRNLSVSIVAILLAYIANFVGWTLPAIVIFFLFLYVFGFLLYHAQLLPESLMSYLDNKLVHDGKTHKKNSPLIISAAATAMNDSFNSESFYVNTTETESNNDSSEKTEPKFEAIRNLILAESKQAGVDCKGMNHLEDWYKSLTQEQTQSQINTIIKKIKAAEGICDTVTFKVSKGNLEVYV